MNKQLVLTVLIVSTSSVIAETFTKPVNQRPDYSAHATGPSLQIDGNNYIFLPQARAERSSKTAESRPSIPSIAVEGLGGLAPSSNNEFLPQAVSSSNGDEYLGSRGRHDIYLSAAPGVQSNSVGAAEPSCGYCQVVINNRTGELALFTNEVLVNLENNTRQFAEQLAADNNVRLKYYMGRIALAVFEAPDAERALELATVFATHPQVTKASNSVVEHDYQPQ